MPGRSFRSVAVGVESPPLSVSEERQLAVLTELPFVVPFEERVKVGTHCPCGLTACFVGFLVAQR